MSNTNLTEEELDVLADKIICNVFGFCGCGRRDATVEFIRCGIEFIKFLETEPEDDSESDAFQTWFKDRNALELELFGTHGEATFFYYVLDQKSLTEHSGRVPGTLTDEGEDLLTMLREWKAVTVALEAQEPVDESSQVKDKNENHA